MADATSTPDPKDQASVYNPAAGFLNAEAKRALAAPVYGTAPSSSPIPRDTVIKRITINLDLSVDATYAAGTPLVSPSGVFDRICSNIELNINGNRIIKSLRPNLIRLMNILVQGNLPRRAYSLTAAVTAPTTRRASREWLAGTVAYPATTGYMLHNESVTLHCENPWGYGGSRFMSELDVRDVASADLKFSWQAISNILQDGNAASVTYGTPTVNVTPIIIEDRARQRPTPGQVLFDYVETYFSRSYTGQGRNNLIDLQVGNFIMGLGILCINGDASQTAQENLLTNMSLMVNGGSAVQGPISHVNMQDDNVQRFGCDDQMGLADFASTIASTASVHPLRGYGMMNFVRNGDWNTAINSSRAGGVDTVKLQFDTPASSGTDAATYTNALQVILHQHDIRPLVYTR